MKYQKGGHQSKHAHTHKKKLQNILDTSHTILQIFLLKFQNLNFPGKTSRRIHGL